MQNNFESEDLASFLENKSLFYDKIDFSYVAKAYELLKPHITLPFVIHIVGTNGKGSTGRFLAHYLHKKDFKVLHYSSPHILNFCERIWLNGKDIDELSLELAHKNLQKIFDAKLLKKLTYFEYTTLLAIFLSSKKDYLVLEAGLGGEYDATNVVKNDLSIITKIGLDHQEFLGNTIEEITKTKLRACDNKMLLALQEFPEVLELAKDYDYFLAKEFDTSSLELPKFLKQNLNTALSALEYLGIEIDLDLLKDCQIFGRCQKINENITIDVGHNPQGAKALLKEFQDKKINLVYASLEIKDYALVLQILKPIIKKVFLLDIQNDKMAKKEDLIKVLKKLNLDFEDFKGIDKQKEYLVFGSFLCVEYFLNTYIFLRR